ncbi:MAG: cytochrome c biogenesis protein [Bacteroidia bacterium]|nr:cytochrome c biogenesis protein [Bacteroidia bacterium]
MVRHLYKAAGAGLVLYALIAGLMTELPVMGPMGQSNRNIFYHVPMWFAVVVMMGVSVFNSIRYLRMTDPDYERSGAGNDLALTDIKASESAKTGVLFNILGLVTGMVWSRVTWSSHLPANRFDAWWIWDPIQICALVSLLIYLAYFLLRSTFQDEEQKAKISSVYNIFAFVTLIPLYFIIPKMLPGAHPTAANSDAGGGSFVMAGKLGGDFSIIFWPSIIGFILMGYWVYELQMRTAAVSLTLSEEE